MTLLRVYTDQETTKGYQFLFSKAFDLVKELTQQQIMFHYLHGNGIKSIVVDMCPKQMAGM
jgi:hypothetical protein